MKRLILITCVVTGILIINACKKNNDTKVGGTAYLDLPATAYQYYKYMSGTGDSVTYNAPLVVMNEKATLGRVLFYDKHLSVNNTIACGSCHKQAFSFADNMPLSPGYENRLTKRNSMAIQNLDNNNKVFFDVNSVQPGGGFGTILFWDGRENSVQDLIAKPVSNHVEMGISDFSSLPTKLSSLPYYASLFNNAFGTTQITTDEISESIADFMLSIHTDNSRFDKYNSGDRTALNALEQEGLTLFLNKYNCGNCHHVVSGVYSTDDFMDTGLDPSYTDDGRGAITGIAADNGKFRAPDLHNVALTAPYMHDGRFKTLDEVIDHYSHGIINSPNLDSNLKSPLTHKPISMNISSQEKDALIAFLNSLTDYGPVTNANYSDPFKVK